MNDLTDYAEQDTPESDAAYAKMQRYVMTVRDHSLPCKHPADPDGTDPFGGQFRFESIYIAKESSWRCEREDCPGGKEITLTVMTDEVWVSVASDNPEFVVMDEYREVVCDSVAPAPVPTYYEVDGND